MILSLFLMLLNREEKRTMAIIYVTLIIKGKKTFQDVPDKLKEQVRQILIDLDLEYLIVE